MCNYICPLSACVRVRDVASVQFSAFVAVASERGKISLITVKKLQKLPFVFYTSVFETL